MVFTRDGLCKLGEVFVIAPKVEHDNVIQPTFENLRIVVNQLMEEKALATTRRTGKPDSGMSRKLGVKEDLFHVGALKSDIEAQSLTCEGKHS